jgi:hypothetical protein
VTDDEKKQQAAVLADIAKHRDVTIEDYNRRRFSANIIIIPETKQRLN